MMALTVSAGEAGGMCHINSHCHEGVECVCGNSIILSSKTQLWGSGGPEHEFADSTKSRKVRLNSGVLMKIAQAFRALVGKQQSI